jgi:prepilin-type processing-associated H-X9-DG protein
MRQWGMAFQMYAGQFNGELAWKSTGGGDGDTAADAIGRWDDSSLWINSLPPFLGMSSYCDLNDPTTNSIPPGPSASTIFVCPSALTVAPGDPTTDIVQGDCFMVYGYEPNTTSTIQTRPTRIDYVINSKLIKTGTDKNVKLSSLNPSSAWALVVEKRVNPSELKSSDENYTKSLAYISAEHKRMASRHQKLTGGHICFADGHVDFVDNKFANTPNPGAAQPPDYNYPDVLMWDPHGPAS